MINIQLYLNLYAYDKYTTLSQSIELLSIIFFQYFQIMTEKQKKEDLIEEKER